MSPSPLKVGLSAFLVAAVFAACTNTYLYDERRDDEVPRDRTLTLEGSFCTPSPNEVVRPIKIIIAMDASQSMNVTDPNGSRAQATVDLLDNLPQEPEISFVVMLFGGSTTAWLSKSGRTEFDRVVDYDQNDKTALRQRILTYAGMGGPNPNRDSTDFVKPLSDIYALINSDIAKNRLAQMNDETRARYSVIFLSDGQPTNNQDDEILCGSAVSRIRQLKDLADDVKVNTVHVFIPTQPLASSACNFDGGITVPAGGNQCGIPDLPPGSCPLLIVNQNAERLNRMANLGGGDFRDFRNSEPINFLNFRFGQVRHTFVFDKLVASNFSAPAGSPLDAGDADSDGLTDQEELIEGTLPWVADTDGDGFSDGVEVWARDNKNGAFTPNQVLLADGGGVDLGCPPELRGVDDDCDTLTNCDEEIIGTNSQRVDSDDDGISDAVEFKLGSQPSSKDLPQDPDNDRLPTGDELTMHMNPLVVDSDNLSVTGYRYQVTKKGGLEPNGKQCWNFRISNVSLANTMPDSRDAGNPDGGEDLPRVGAGFNNIFVSYSMLPGDDPTAKSVLRTFRHTSSRFPVGGIKSPHDGIIKVKPEDFVSGCQSVVQSAP
ncbi:MAG: VWA domain-containing protein [Archangium sp.]|nr:VWA domain-containing protein [Archangium sp.]